MNKYVLVYTSDIANGKCSNCNFAGKYILEVNTEQEVIDKWIKAKANNKQIEVFKRIDIKIGVQQ